MCCLSLADWLGEEFTECILSIQAVQKILLIMKGIIYRWFVDSGNHARLRVNILSNVSSVRYSVMSLKRGKSGVNKPALQRRAEILSLVDVALD
jgi:hypothetical protein